jgi:hypothetical protein
MLPFTILYILRNMHVAAASTRTFAVLIACTNTFYQRVSSFQ